MERTDTQPHRALATLPTGPPARLSLAPRDPLPRTCSAAVQTGWLCCVLMISLICSYQALPLPLRLMVAVKRWLQYFFILVAWA